MNKNIFQDNPFITSIQNREPRKVLFFYHAIDLDGVGAFILLQLLSRQINSGLLIDEPNQNQRVYTKLIEYHYVMCEKTADSVNAYIDNEIYQQYTDIIIVDVSVSNKEIADKLQKIKDEGINVVMLDHHASAQWLNEYDYASIQIHDIKNNIVNSGTSLFYEFLKPLFASLRFSLASPVGRFAELVSHYDTFYWDAHDEQSPYDLNLLFKSMVKSEFINLMIKNIEKRCVFDKLSAVKIATMRDIIEKEKFKAQKSMKTYVERGIIIGCLFANNYISEIGNYLCKEYPNLDCVLMLDPGTKSFSLRSIKDIDFSKVAKELGGGGHPQACGFMFKNDWDIPIEKLIGRFDDIDSLLMYGANNVANCIQKLNLK